MKKTIIDQKIKNKERKRALKYNSEEEIGLSTLEKEARISEDLSNFTSNLDIGFHQLTEQYDTGSLKSLLMNTLAISSEITLDIDKEKPKVMMPQEEIDPDSESEMRVDINYNQLDNMLCHRLLECDYTQNRGKSNKLVIDEFDIFIEMRIHQDGNPTDFYDIFKEKYQENNQENLESKP